MCSFLSILENDLIISFPACSLPAANCILSALSDVCIQNETLCCAMLCCAWTKIPDYLNISQPQKFIPTFHFIKLHINIVFSECSGLNI